MKSCLRLRLSDADAHYGGGLVDGARLLALFGDAATELCILAYGDEGLFRAYQSVDFLAPVYAGDFLQVEAEVVRWGGTSIEMAFIAKKVIAGALSLGETTKSRADAASEEVVCRARGTCVVPVGQQQRLLRQRHNLGRPGVCVITAAIVGAETTREQTPFLPIRPDEIAAEAKRCVLAGASVIHLHVRDEAGRPSQDRQRFADTIRAIRAATADVGGVIVQVSTGGAVGMNLEERVGHLTLTDSEAPDMATLNIGSLNFGNDVFVNAPVDVRETAARIRAAGLAAEVEIYDLGHVDLLARLLKQNSIAAPVHVQFVLGVPGGLPASRENLATLLRAMDQLKVHYAWGVAGIGRFQLPMAELAILQGGHVRVGLEDNIYLEKGVLAEGSSPLVARARESCERLGRKVASVVEARSLLLTNEREGFIGAT